MTANKAEIAKQLWTMIEEHLFGPKPWPIDNNHAVGQRLVDWGLIEMRGDRICRTTKLGLELNVDAWTMFTGHHEPAEIPHYLSDRGLITEQEADDIMSRHWDDGERLEDLLPPVLRRVYRAQPWGAT
jgi:hypothetical protein